MRKWTERLYFKARRASKGVFQSPPRQQGCLSKPDAQASLSKPDAQARVSFKARPCAKLKEKRQGKRTSNRGKIEQFRKKSG
jgi:hypothetical protein